MSKQLSPNQIIDVVCKALNIDDITTETRKTQYAHARFIAINLLGNLTKLNNVAIGSHLKRDVSTIYWGIHRFSSLNKGKNIEFIEKITTVNKALKKHESSIK